MTELHPLAVVPVALEVTALPKTDLHLHAESDARLDQLLARLGRRTEHNWRAWVERLMAEFPPGLERLARLNGDLDAAELASLDEGASYTQARLEIMMEEAAADGALYIEIRLGGASIHNENLMQSFRAAEQKVQQTYPGFDAEAIITWGLASDPAALAACVSRSLEAAQEGLAGVDFGPFPYDAPAGFSEIYRLAEKAAAAGLGITCHVDEFAPANTLAAVGIPGLTRLGHAIHAARFPGALEDLARRGITIESCLSCNVVLGAVPSYHEHPIRRFIDAGVRVSLCSDDPVRVCTTIGREYAIAGALGFSLEELRAFTANGIEAAFTSNQRKAALMTALEASLPA